MPHEKLRPSFTFDADRLAELRRIAPEAFADGRINFDTLREALGDYLEHDGPDAEHFGLNWPGKHAARRLASMPSKGALVPVPGAGLDEENSRNVFIEGENLEVLKLLQKAYAGRIKMIYIDPPYNTGNDFVYEDDFKEPLQEYLRRTGQLDEEGRKLSSNTRADGRFHSKWLSMMYPRLRLARNLLKEDGLIFVSIDDNEVHNLREILNEVFGEENFIAQLVWSGGRKNDSKFISVSHEYVVCFVKSIDFLRENKIIWRQKKEGLKEIYAKYNELKNKYNKDYDKISTDLKAWYKSLPDDAPSKEHKHYSAIDRRGIYFPDNISWPGGGGPKYEILHPITNKPVTVPSRGWMFGTKERMAEAVNDERVHFGPDETYVPCIKSYLVDREEQVPYSVIYQDGRAATKRLRALLGEDYFEHPKDEEVLAKLFSAVTKEDDIILDFFAGSGTTAHSTWILNSKDLSKRQFICVQLPEQLEPKTQAYKDGFRVISEISIKRLKAASRQIKGDKGATSDLGFRVFRLTPSHYKAWQHYEGTDVKELEHLFSQFESPLREGWTPEGLLTEVMLLEGFPLDSRQEALGGYTHNRVVRVASDFCAHALLVCLDARVHPDTIAALEPGPDDVFICLDSALSDEQKARLSDKGMLKTI